MTTAAAHQVTHPRRPHSAELPPALDQRVVVGWQESGTELIELLARARELGPLSRFDLGPRRTVLVTGPEQVQHVLAQHPDRYVKQSHRARVLLGDGLISATGDAWKQQRRLLQSQFTTTGVRRYEQRIAEAARRTTQLWADRARTGEPTDVGADMQFFALDTIWRSLTGRPLDARTHRELGAIDTVVATLPTAAAAPPADPGAVEDALARIDSTAERVIRAARRECEQGAEREGTGLLHVLLEASKTRPEYTDRLIRDELVTLLVAGHETTAKTLAWLFLLLDQNPDIRDWAVASSSSADPDERRDAVNALVAEALRLYPAVWLIPRHAVEDDVLDGYLIEAGSHVLVSPYLTHRDPELWPEPERFDPLRFLVPGRKPGRPGSYYPFGLGARACLGQQFSLREMAVLLELLLPAYTPAFRDPPTRAVFGANLRPDGAMPAVINRIA